MNVYQHNKKAWDENVKRNDIYTRPATAAEINAARSGSLRISLTGNKQVPAAWLTDIKDKQVLCLASGGGLQAPILAAAGAVVTVLDSSPLQLEQDYKIAKLYNLQLEIVEGDMQDLSHFSDETFDYILHPVANVFIENVQRLWQEAYRVLKSDGILLAGIANPIIYIFDQAKLEQGQFEVRNKLPYSDVKHLPQQQLEYYLQNNIPLEFGHTLEQQIGGLCQAGFLIAGFFEDDFNGEDILDDYLKSLIVLKAVKGRNNHRGGVTS